MNTQTHLLLASAVLGRNATRREHTAILAGALAPDLSIFVFAGWGAASGLSAQAMWGEAYWTEPWQTLSAVSNSVPAWGALLAASFALPGAWRRTGLVFCAAALLHLAFDLPLHADDAHRHLWPLTDWRFRSPVSYWDPAHHGRVASLVEAAAGLGLVAALRRRHRRRRARAALAVAAVGYVAVPLFWIASLQGGS